VFIAGKPFPKFNYTVSLNNNISPARCRCVQ
jgi:hypothetical protein